MKLLLLVLNLAFAVGLIFCGNFAAAAHRTHAYSMYHELKERRVLVERDDYDVSRAMMRIAAGGDYYRIVSWLGAAACVINAFGIGVLMIESREASKV